MKAFRQLGSGQIFARLLIVFIAMQIFIIGWFYYSGKKSASLAQTRIQNITEDLYLVPEEKMNFVNYFNNILQIRTSQNFKKNGFTFPTFESLPNIFNKWSILDLNPDSYDYSSKNTENRNHVPRFNFLDETEYKIAVEYRKHQLPFILYNVPEFNRTTKIWTHKYLMSVFGNQKLSVERAADNKFMYYSVGDVKQKSQVLFGWTPPQEDLKMTYPMFTQLVNSTLLHNEVNSTSMERKFPHYYLTINAGMGARTDWIREAFPYFEVNERATVDMKGLKGSDVKLPKRNVEKYQYPYQAEVFRPLIPMQTSKSSKSSFYKGINCRIGMEGSIAAAHYDSHDNFVVIVRGIRRYILMPPKECSKLDLYKSGHPSARHSSFDWTNATEISLREELKSSRALEFVLVEGDVLYIPSYWIHYIISLTNTVQCNGRMSVESAIGGHEKEFGGHMDVINCIVDKPRKTKEKRKSAEILSQIVN